MANYSSSYNDLFPVDPSFQSIKSSPIDIKVPEDPYLETKKSSPTDTEASGEPSGKPSPSNIDVTHETSSESTDDPHRNTAQFLNLSDSSILTTKEKVESTTDSPQEGSTTNLEQTTRNITHTGSLVETEPEEPPPQEPPPQEPLTRCQLEKVRFQLLETQSLGSCDCPSRRTTDLVQKRSTTSCIKKCPKQRMIRVDRNYVRYNPSREPLSTCNAINSQLPSVIAVQTEANYPSAEERPSKCDVCKYRTSIENWEPLKGAIYCPKCQHYETPLLRTKTKKTKTLMNSSCCLAHCWPLCFIPYLFATPPQHFLHCAECFKFLGTYDESHKCIRPNREYLDCSQCFSAEETKRKERLQNEQKWKEYLDC